MESSAALAACDAAVVVCEPDEKRVPALQLILKRLEDRGIPHLLFLNKIDSFDTRVRDILPMLQPASTKPLVLRQIPIWKDGVATGYVDLATERAFIYREHADRLKSSRCRPDVKDRETRSALPDARTDRRLRRRADGAIALRHAAATRSHL